MATCTGNGDCTVHPNIRQDHPAGPVEVRMENGTVVTVDYSGDWNESEGRWLAARALLPPEWFDDAVEGK